LAIGAIVLLSGINYLGVRPGAITQNVFTLLKLSALGCLIVAGLASTHAPTAGTAAGGMEGGSVALALGAAMVPVLFSYGGWQQTNFVAQELIEPEKNLPRALISGVAIVVAVYLLANFAYLRALGVEGLAASSAPAADSMEVLLGTRGRTFIATGIAISTFGFLNLVILVSPRVYQTMASDGLFFPSLARLHPRYRTPSGAIVFQAIWAVILTVTGRYGDLLDYVVFGDWIFFGATAATLFFFRAREKTGRENAGIRFRMWGHPIGTTIFVLAAVYVVVGSIASNPGNAVRGTVLILLGVPVFRWWSGRTSTTGARGQG